jgi:hypothetical protein
MQLPPATAALLLGLVWAGGCQRPTAELPTATATAIQTQPAVSGSSRTLNDDGRREPSAITWDELDVGIHAESRFEPWMMKTSIQSLEGQPVRITGYMHGGVAVKEGIREFVLLRNIDCPYGRQGEAHHVMVVQLGGDLRTSYSSQALAVEGTFHIRPCAGPDGTTWSLYALDEARLTPSNESTTLPPDPIHSKDGENSP